MNKYLIAITLAISLASCSESFKNIDPKSFNEKIAGITDIKTPEELMKLYYGTYENDKNSKLTITSSDKQEENNYEITLIHEGIKDDSQSGRKIIMKAKLDKQIWTVTEIKESWKCHNGRGHTDWGATTCN